MLGAHTYMVKYVHYTAFWGCINHEYNFLQQATLPAIQKIVKLLEKE